MFPRSNINLAGNRMNSLTLNGFNMRCLTLHGLLMGDPNSFDDDDEEKHANLSQNPDFIKIKLYIMTNLINPLLKKKLDVLRQNYYAINTLQKQLEQFKGVSNISEIALFKGLLDVVLVSMNTSNNNAALQKTLYGNSQSSKLLITTKTIMLSAPYEIYNLFFGKPEKKEGAPAKYDNVLIDYIKKLLDRDPFILHDRIRDFLRANFYDRLKNEYKDIKDRETIDKNKKKKLDRKNINNENNSIHNKSNNGIESNRKISEIKKL